MVLPGHVATEIPAHFTDFIQCCLAGRPYPHLGNIRLFRKRTAITTILKVKSYSDILLNERADNLAGQGCESEEEIRWPGPCKLDPLRLPARTYVRETYAPIPDQNIADKVRIPRASKGVGRAVAALRGTIFGKGMLRDPVNCNVILTAVHSQPAATIEVWIQAVTETYPTMARLHLCTPAKHPSSTCPRCSANVPETLVQFISVSTAFHHARTAAHNQVWQPVTSALKRALQPE